MRIEVNIYNVVADLYKACLEELEKEDKNLQVLKSISWFQLERMISFHQKTLCTQKRKNRIYLSKKMEDIEHRNEEMYEY